MDNFDTDCLILGGGVAGLAIGSEIAEKFKNPILLERNKQLGQEASSRNSEVIHAGIYYSPDSLKAKLCVSGKEYLYNYLEERNLNFNRCGKFILSSNLEESEKLFEIKENAKNCGISDLTFKNSGIDNYDFLSYKDYLFSPSTGIFDSHSYMLSLEGDFVDHGGIVLLGNEVIHVFKEKNFFKVLVKDKNNNIEFYINSKVLINCLGLSSIDLSNEIYESQRHKLRLLKGEYYNYSGTEKLHHLIYPLPKEKSLGTHATIDLGNGIRFGPSAYEVEEISYDIDDNQKEDFLNSIRKYWPNLDEENLNPDYSGIRGLVDGSNDFVIEAKHFDSNLLVDVLGYVSPGLTASLATAKYVKKLLNNFT